MALVMSSRRDFLWPSSRPSSVFPSLKLRSVYLPLSRPLPSLIRFHLLSQGLQTCKLRKQVSVFLPRATIEQTASNETQEVVDAEDEVCELVNRLELTLGEGSDLINAYLVKAIKNNNGGAVLLLTDVYGQNNNDTRDFAYHLSCFGYNVLVPDLFRGMPWSSDFSKDKYEEWRCKHPPERVAKDIDTASSWLLEEMEAAGVQKRLAVVGFCFGGGHAIETLARDAACKFATAVIFYPTRFNEVIAAKIKVPILLIIGDQDELCDSTTIQNMAAKIEGSQVQVYPGRGHAFAHHPSSPEEDEDAENAFSAMRFWLHEKLLLQSERSISF